MYTKYKNPKVTVPISPPNIIDRPRLLSFLEHVDFKKVTIIRAPAGYGKTSVATQLLKATNTPFAWLSIDEKDNDITRFWSYFVQSFEQGLLNFDHQTASSNLIGNDEAKYDFLMNAILTKLEQLEQPFYIVLDDYHFIDNPQIHQMLTYFIERLPSPIHLFITTRTRPPFPIAKWYVKQWVQEISAEQLKFTVHETEKYLANYSNWDLTQDEVQQITEKTEGWIAALQLFRLQEKNFSSLKDVPMINYFLIEEIIQNLPDDLQQFLYKTSILNILEPHFCNELTGLDNSEEILHSLEERGIFTIRIHHAQPIYRYHHLFQDVLQEQLHKHYTHEQIVDISTRAASLYEENGDYRSAIELALSTGLYELAQQWLKKHLAPFLRLSEMATFMRWLEQLYEHLEVVDIELLIDGFCHAITQRNDELANQYMNALDTMQQTDKWMEKEENAVLASIYARSKAYYYIAIVGDNAAAMEIARGQINQSFSLDVRELLPMSYNAGQYTLLRTPFAGQGRIPTLQEFDSILHLFLHTPYKDLYVSKFGAGIMAEIYVERLNEKEALPILEFILQYGIEQHDDSLIVPMVHLKSNILKGNGQLSTAIGVLLHSFDIVKDPYWKSLIHIMVADGMLDEGLIEQAELALQTYKLANPLWSFAQAKLHFKQRNFAEALKIVSYVKEKAITEQQIFTQFEATVFETLCYLALENTELALVSFKNAITLAAKHYYARTILQHNQLRPLLAQIQAEDNSGTEVAHYLSWLNSISTAESTIQKRLTSREFAIFDELCKGSSNREIAQSLNLSEGTIRIYLSTIYSKLGVNSRAKAILLKDY